MKLKQFHILPPISTPRYWGIRVDGKNLVLFSTKHRGVYIVPATGGRKGWDVVGDI